MLIEIYGDTRRPSYCDICGADIEWATVVANDRAAAFNRPIDPIRIEAALYGHEREILVLDTTVTTAHVTTCCASQPSAAR